jgi:putative ABC transport system permease protein
MARSLIETGARGLAGRFLGSRKLRALLTVLGVAFGVALIAALTVLGTTLQASINDQLREGFGTYDVMAGYDGGRLMTPTEQARAKAVPGVRYMVGALYLTTEQSQAPYNYIGIGEFPKDGFAYPLSAGRYPGPGEIVTEPRMADMLGLTVGDTLTLPFKAGPQTVTLVGLTRATGQQSSDTLMFNLAWLQQKMGLDRQVTLLLTGLQPGADKEIVEANLRLALPDLHIELRRELDEARENMGGLKPMAIAFGIAGLFAAIFLVAGSFSIAVQERTRELALLRAVGASQQQVMRLMLWEAVLLGALGGISGAALGGLGAWGTLGLAAVSLGVRQHAVVFPWLALALEALGGMVLAVLAAWRPARVAGAVPPLQAMRSDATAAARQEKAGGIGGLVLMGIALALEGLATQIQSIDGPRALVGALGGVLLTAGLIMAQPRILPGLMAALSAPLRLLAPAEAAMAGRSVLRHRKRSALTAATLILGIMLVTSVGTVFAQVGVNGDIYIHTQIPADGTVTVRFEDLNDLGTGLPGRLEAIDGVTAAAAAGRRHWGHLDGFDFTKADPGWLKGNEGLDSMGLERRTDFNIVPLDLVAADRVFDFEQVRGSLTEAGIVLTEGDARNRGIEVGDMLRIRDWDRSARGIELTEAVPYKVVAIVDRLPLRSGEVAVSRSLFPNEQDTRVLFNYDQTMRTAVKEAVLAVLREPAYQHGRLQDLQDTLAQNRQMMLQRSAILWAVTLVILLIATFGLFNTTVMGLHQRRREIATIRAVGATPRQIIWQIIMETVLVGLAGSLLGIAAGTAFVGAVWVGLNDGSLSLWYGRGLFLASLVAGPALAALAGLLPAVGIARGKLSRALQIE